MADFLSRLQTAHKQLNESYEIYTSLPKELAKEFYEIKLQASIFQYEVCTELFAFNTTEPTGFARKIALKGLIHKLFEYDLVYTHLVKRLKSLAEKRGFDVSDSNLKDERRKWRSEFKKLRNWSTIRNKATGHYDLDTTSQITLLESISPEQVLMVCVAFFSSNKEFLKMLRSVGRGNST